MPKCRVLVWFGLFLFILYFYFLVFILHNVLWISRIHSLVSATILIKFLNIITSYVLFSLSFPSGIPITYVTPLETSCPWKFQSTFLILQKNLHFSLGSFCSPIFKLIDSFLSRVKSSKESIKGIFASFTMSDFQHFLFFPLRSSISLLPKNFN